MKKNKNKKFSSKPMQTVKSDPPTSWKKRLPAFILLAFMIFWTLGSVLAVWLSFDNKSNSSMISASADGGYTDLATNNSALEVQLDGLTNMFVYANNGSESVTVANPYVVSYYFDNRSGPQVFLYNFAKGNDSAIVIPPEPDKKTYSFGSTSIQTFPVNVPTLGDSDFDTQCCIAVSGYRPSLLDIPVNVIYRNQSSNVYENITYFGCSVLVVFQRPNNTLYATSLFYGFCGTASYVGICRGYQYAYTIPNAPLSYKLYKERGITPDSILRLEEDIERLTESYYERYDEGYTEGFDIGYDGGYADGYNEGIADSNEYSFTSLISAVVDVPIQTFTSLFNFDFLGVNLASFFLSLLTVAIILTIVKLFL